MQCGLIYSPDEVVEDRHFLERGWPTPVEHPELGETFIYPGAPYRMPASPWQIYRRAPLLGEHTTEVLAEIGMADQEAALRSAGVIA
jgi:crotonobetainyl-CoA:carnitine CoA-transferase CaiB-like acyl-CoA transferase